MPEPVAKTHARGAPREEFNLPAIHLLNAKFDLVTVRISRVLSGWATCASGPLPAADDSFR